MSGGGTYSGFQVTGMIEGIFGFEKWQYFFGYSNNLKIRDSSYVSRSRSSPNIFLWLGNLAWDCFGFCLKP